MEELEGGGRARVALESFPATVVVEPRDLRADVVMTEGITETPLEG